MRELYASLPEKPEWLTLADIDRYAQRMEPPYEVTVYHHFENGFDEKLDYQTLAEAEHAAQQYVAGTMEGEDGFAYDGAAVYDLHEHKWLRVFGDFSDERAIEQADLQPKKEEHSHCRRSTPAVSALLSQPCTRRSPGISAMISTSPMTPWATAPPARNTRPMLPPSAP